MGDCSKNGCCTDAYRVKVFTAFPCWPLCEKHFAAINGCSWYREIAAKQFVARARMDAHIRAGDADKAGDEAGLVCAQESAMLKRASEWLAMPDEA